MNLPRVKKFNSVAAEILNSKHFKIMKKLVSLNMLALKCAGFILVMLTLSFYNANAQSRSISLKASNVTVNQALDMVRNASKLNVIFSPQEVDLNKKVSFNFNNTPILNALENILSGQNLKVTLVDNRAIISKAEATKGSKRVIGVVKNRDGELLPGVSIQVKGSSRGVATDIDGKFSLDANAGESLVFSFVGYETQIIAAQESPMNVVLALDAKQLEEVVVVGYGVQAKVNLTGAVAQIKGADLQDRPITNVSQAMQGTMPGVTITSGQGRPGQDGGTIRIRGVGTLNNSNPYILVDGVEAGSFNQIDPNDIESISILKDAGSAAIYGSKASNGVILITTKRGKGGKAITSYSGYAGWQTPTTMVDRLSSADYAQLYNQALTAEGKAARFTNDEVQKFKSGTDPNYPNTDWYGLAFRTGFQHSHNVNVAGGNDNVKYMVSVGYLNQEGILPNSNREQFNGRSNLDIKLTDKLSAKVNMAYINNDYRDANSSYAPGSSDQIIRQLNLIAPWIVNRYLDGTYGTIGDGNPIAWLDLGQSVNRLNSNFTGTIALDYTLMKGLKLSANATYIGNNQDYKMFVKDIQYNPNKYHGPNSLTQGNYSWNRSNFDGLLNYDKSIESHNFKLMLGYHAEKYTYKELVATRKNFPSNNLDEINAGSSSTSTNSGFSRQLNMLSYFGRFNYDFAGRYLFEANFRADASSRFAAGNRWGYFPSLSGAWRISEEAFMEGIKGALSNLKLRLSWGKLGNQDALDDYYPALTSYNVGLSYPFDGVLVSGIGQTSFKDPSIRWESARTYGVGFDIGLFSKVNIGIDYYNRNTTGIIMDVPVPETFGLGTYKSNVGGMENKGIEFSVGYEDKWGDFSLSANANISYNKNKITNLGGVNRIIEGSSIKQIGEAINSYFVYKVDGIFQSQAEADAFTTKYGNPFGKAFKAGDLRYVDANGDGKLNSNDRIIGNSTDPKYIFGFNLSSTYKNFDLGMTFAGAAGVSRFFNNEVYGEFSGDAQHPSTVWLDAWSTTNTGGKYPRVAEARVSPSNPYNVASTFWVSNTSYLRLKNVQLGYALPESLLKKYGISRLRVYLSGENLLTFDSLDIDVDPEAPAGRGSNYPLIKTASVGVNLTF